MPKKKAPAAPTTTKKFYALALDEDQCRAVLAACTSAQMHVIADRETYDRVMKQVGMDSQQLVMLYGGVVDYVAGKLEER